MQVGSAGRSNSRMLQLEYQTSRQRSRRQQGMRDSQMNDSVILMGGDSASHLNSLPHGFKLLLSHSKHHLFDKNCHIIIQFLSQHSNHYIITMEETKAHIICLIIYLSLLNRQTILQLHKSQGFAQTLQDFCQIFFDPPSPVFYKDALFVVAAAVAATHIQHP